MRRSGGAQVRLGRTREVQTGAGAAVSRRRFRAAGGSESGGGGPVVVCGPGFCSEEDCFTRSCGFLLDGDGSQLHV